MGAAPGPEGILKSLADVASLSMVDPTTTRLNEWIKATRRLVQEVGDEVLVIARADAGPFSLAAQLRGMEHFLLEVGESRHPEEIHRLLQFCADYGLWFARLLLEAGAPIVTIGDALASGSLISPATYERYVYPYHRYMAERVYEMGGLFSIHICGRNTRAFPKLVTTGADVLEFDALTDFTAAWEAADGHCCLLGSVPVSEVLTLGSPEEIEVDVRDRLAKVIPSSRYILSSGCALSSNVPAANLHAMVAAGRTYGRYPDNSDPRTSA
jgi:uroporphyrinogen decarboxylase